MYFNQLLMRREVVLSFQNKKTHTGHVSASSMGHFSDNNPSVTTPLQHLLLPRALARCVLRPHGRTSAGRIDARTCVREVPLPGARIGRFNLRQNIREYKVIGFEFGFND